MKSLNILLLSCRPFPSTDGWYIFYRQMQTYLRQKGADCKLYKICRDKSTDIPIDAYDGFYLPDEHVFRTEKNIACLTELVKSKNIQVVFNFNHATDFLEDIKSILPELYLFDLIHSRPNLVVQNKKVQLQDLKFNQISSLKVKLQWLFPRLYLWLLQRKMRKFLLRTYRLFDRTVLLSPSYIKEFEELVGLPHADKVVAIPNPLPVLESKVSIGQKKKEILFVGRISVEKALYRLLYIWEKVQSRIPEWQLRIVGDGAEKQNCVRLAESLGLKNVHFEGFQNAVPYIQQAAIVCLVSNAEGLPMVFMEAMTLGTVPVGFNSFSAIYDMIEDRKNGIIVPAFDLDQYADRLVELAQDDSFRCELARNARIAVEKFDISKVGELWFRVFQELNLV